MTKIKVLIVQENYILNGQSSSERNEILTDTSYNVDEP